MRYANLLPVIRDVLSTFRQHPRLEETVPIILEKACALVGAAHGSFVRVNPHTRRLTIVHAFGSDWTPAKLACQLQVGQGLTGLAAATGAPQHSGDTLQDPNYYPLFEYVRSELVVPVIVQDAVWGLINIDASEPHAFDEGTIDLLAIFAEVASFAITLQIELAEQENLSRKLLQSEKLASLGETIAGIAHELNNPLTSIMINASLLEAQAGTPATRQSARSVVTESQRAAGLVKGLLEFSRKDTGEREVVNVEEAVRDVISLRQTQPRRKNVRYELAAEGRPLRMQVNVQQLQQVMLNLFTNAEHAIAPTNPDGRIRVKVMEGRGTARIQVSDNGHGVASGIRSSIFDPFFTTKSNGEGTGLGLSIVHTIVASHGGSVSLAESTPAGSTFVIELPCLESSDVRIQNLDTKPVQALEGRVLIVDDEPCIADTLASFLRHMKVDVVRAYSVKAALEHLRSELVDVILSDVLMPDRDGFQFYEEAKAVNPLYAERFVFMSGFYSREQHQSFFSKHRLECLPKPFTLDQLHRVLARHLERSRRVALRS